MCFSDEVSKYSLVNSINNDNYISIYEYLHILTTGLFFIILGVLRY